VDPEVALAPVTTPSDLSEVRELLLEYGRSLSFALCFATFEKELAELPGDYAPPRGGLWIARIGKEPAGCVALRPLGDDVGEVKRLFVRPAWRGHGLGRVLMEHLLAEARARGYRRVRLDTLPVMESARALYVALGFRPIPPYHQHPVVDADCFELQL
jgi:GNAT superfamily N-acetyltransferase